MKKRPYLVSKWFNTIPCWYSSDFKMHSLPSEKKIAKWLETTGRTANSTDLARIARFSLRKISVSIKDIEDEKLNVYEPTHTHTHDPLSQSTPLFPTGKSGMCDPIVKITKHKWVYCLEKFSHPHTQTHAHTYKLRAGKIKEKRQASEEPGTSSTLKTKISGKMPPSPPQTWRFLFLLFCLLFWSTCWKLRGGILSGIAASIAVFATFFAF